MSSIKELSKEEVEELVYDSKYIDYDEYLDIGEIDELDLHEYEELPEDF